MSAQFIPLMKLARKLRPLPLHVCTSKPMILTQYHKTRMAEQYFLDNTFHIQPANIAKVECRDKTNFVSAETHLYMCAKRKYSINYPHMIQ